MNTTPHTNANVLRRAYEAFVGDNRDEARPLVGDEFVWHMAGRNILTGDYSGLDEVIALFQRMSALTNGTYGVEVHETLANDVHGVAITLAAGERDGRQLGDRHVAGLRMGVTVCHMSDGKLAECWYYPPSQYFEDEFWSSSESD
jgi:ketosteroid isomerase-like protein